MTVLLSAGPSQHLLVAAVGGQSSCAGLDVSAVLAADVEERLGDLPEGAHPGGVHEGGLDVLTCEG
jgi:hypothetical protein